MEPVLWKRHPRPLQGIPGQDCISEVLLPESALSSSLPEPEPQARQAPGAMTAQRDHTGAAENRLGLAGTPGNSDSREGRDGCQRMGQKPGALEQVKAEEWSAGPPWACRTLICASFGSFCQRIYSPTSSLLLHSALFLPSPVHPAWPSLGHSILSHAAARLRQAGVQRWSTMVPALEVVLPWLGAKPCCLLTYMARRRLVRPLLLGVFRAVIRKGLPAQDGRGLEGSESPTGWKLTVATIKSKIVNSALARPTV